MFLSFFFFSIFKIFPDFFFFLQNQKIGLFWQAINGTLYEDGIKNFISSSRFFVRRLICAFRYVPKRKKKTFRFTNNRNIIEQIEIAQKANFLHAMPPSSPFSVSHTTNKTEKSQTNAKENPKSFESDQTERLYRFNECMCVFLFVMCVRSYLFRCACFACAIDARSPGTGQFLHLFYLCIYIIPCLFVCIVQKQSMNEMKTRQMITPYTHQMKLP